MKRSNSYLISGVVCAITIALFLGYLFNGVKQSFVGYSPMASNWAFWTICFSVILITYTFLPKPLWLSCSNSWVLLFISILIIEIGHNLSPTIGKNIFDVALLSVFTGGGPLWILLAAWIWHFIAALSLSKEINPVSEEQSMNEDA